MNVVRRILQASLAVQAAGVMVALFVAGLPGLLMVGGGIVVMVATGCVLGGTPDDC